MSSRSKVKEEFGERKEGDLKELGPHISRILGMREGVGAAYQRSPVVADNLDRIAKTSTKIGICLFCIYPTLYLI